MVIVLASQNRSHPLGRRSVRTRKRAMQIFGFFSCRHILPVTPAFLSCRNTRARYRVPSTNMDACKLHDLCKTRTHARTGNDGRGRRRQRQRRLGFKIQIQAAERLRCIICSRLRHVWVVQRRLQCSVAVTPCDLGARDIRLRSCRTWGAVLYSACLLSRACAADGDDDSRSPVFFSFVATCCPDRISIVWGGVRADDRDLSSSHR